MILLKNIVIFAMMSFWCLGDITIGQRSKRDADYYLEKIYDMVSNQNDKINRLHTLILANQYIPQCATAIKSKNLIISTKCWQNMWNEIKTLQPYNATEIKLFSRLVTETYDGNQAQLAKIVNFIKNNVEKGSELAVSGYKALLTAMEDYNQLYTNIIPEDDGLGTGLVEYIYRTLIEIKKEEGVASPIFTEFLPSALNSILTETEVFIRNSVTKDLMFAPPDNSNDEVTKVLVDAGNNGSDSRYIWKLKPVEFRWNENDQELFYIENTSNDKILAVADGDGSLRLAEKDNERLKSTWAMFYIRLVKGNSGEEVAILCSYWGIKSLALDDRGNMKMPRLLESNTLQDIPTSIWLLQPKVK